MLIAEQHQRPHQVHLAPMSPLVCLLRREFGIITGGGVGCEGVFVARSIDRSSFLGVASSNDCLEFLPEVVRGSRLLEAVGVLLPCCVGVLLRESSREAR